MSIYLENPDGITAHGATTMQQHDAERIIFDAIEAGTLDYTPSPYTVGAGWITWQGERIPTNSARLQAIAQQLMPAVVVTTDGPAYLLPGLEPTPVQKGDASQLAMF